jgi:hypothetical protein
MATAAPVAGEGGAGRQDRKSGDCRKVNHSHDADSDVEPL